MIIKINNSKYNFYLENGYLVITKRRLFGEKEIKKIKCLTIENIKYKDPYDDVNFVMKIFYYLFSFFVEIVLSHWHLRTENVWKHYLIIIYKVNNDKAIFSLDIKLKEDDFRILKKNIVTNCSSAQVRTPAPLDL